MSNIDNQEPLLRVEHLCQYFKSGNYENKAVNDVSFDIKKGEVFGLVGESGCGKTTTGRSIIRIYDITSGSIYFKGQRICAGTRSYKDAIKAARKELKTLKPGDPMSEQRRRELEESISFNRDEIRKAKFDHKNSDRVYAEKLVKEVRERYEPQLKAAEGDPVKLAELKKKYKDELRVAKNTKLITQAYIDEKVYEILEMVGLVREHAGRYPHEFSGGQRQRIGIARSVIMKPDLLIADEPISALDVSIQAQVINLLNDLRDQLGLTILFIAHDLSVVKYFSDRIGVMYYGNMVELAPSEELFAHPMHPYTRSLLSAIPLPDPRAEKRRKRITYNALAAHDYSVDKPTLREIIPGHFRRRKSTASSVTPSPFRACC